MSVNFLRRDKKGVDPTEKGSRENSQGLGEEKT